MTISTGSPKATTPTPSKATIERPVPGAMALLEQLQALAEGRAVRLDGGTTFLPLLADRAAHEPTEGAVW